MSMEKQEKLMRFFDKKIAECKQRELALLQDERKDEADFEKVRSNIYDIFRIVFQVAVGNSNGEEQIIEFFQKRAEQIPAGWRQSYERAEQHGDMVKVQIETVKLEVVQEVKKVFEQIYQEEVA